MGKTNKSGVPAVGENIYPHDGSPDTSVVCNDRGLKLTLYAWRVSEPKAAVLLIHGVQTHARFEFLRHLVPEDPDLPLPAATSEDKAALGGQQHGEERYVRWCIYEGSWVQQLNEAGYSVYAGDLESFGLSEGWMGRRCSVERLDHFASDVVTFAEHVAEDLSKRAAGGPPPRIILVGISMGGFSVLRGLELMGENGHWLVRAGETDTADNRPRIEGCVGLAPMLSIAKASSGLFNKCIAKVGGLLSRVSPHLGVVKVPAARLAWVDTQKLEDPLVTCPLKIPCRMAVEVLNAIPTVHEKAKFIPNHMRLLIIHAQEDTIVEPEGSIRFHNESAVHITNRQLRILEGDRGHYLVIEPENAEVVSAIKDWIRL